MVNALDMLKEIRAREPVAPAAEVAPEPVVEETIGAEPADVGPVAAEPVVEAEGQSITPTAIEEIDLPLRNGKTRKVTREDLLRFATIGEDREFRNEALRKQREELDARDQHLAALQADVEGQAVGVAQKYVGDFLRQNPDATARDLIAMIEKGGASASSGTSDLEKRLAAQEARLAKYEEALSQRSQIDEVRATLDRADEYAAAKGLGGYQKFKAIVGEQKADFLLLASVRPGPDGRSEMTVEEAVEEMHRRVLDNLGNGTTPAPAGRGKPSLPKPRETAPPRLSGGGAPTPGVEKVGSGKGGRFTVDDLLSPETRAMRRASVIFR